MPHKFTYFVLESLHHFFVVLLLPYGSLFSIFLGFLGLSFLKEFSIEFFLGHCSFSFDFTVSCSEFLVLSLLSSHEFCLLCGFALGSFCSFKGSFSNPYTVVSFLVSQDLDFLVGELAFAVAELVVSEESVFSDEFPVLLIWELLDCWSVLIFSMKIQFGGEDYKTAHFHVIYQLEEYVFIPTIIINHGSWNNKIVFLIVMGSVGLAGITNSDFF